MLEQQRPFIETYTSEGILDNMIAGEYAMSNYWNGASLRVRRERDTRGRQHQIRPSLPTRIHRPRESFMDAAQAVSKQ